MIALALIAPAPAGAAPAIEQYGSELGVEARPEAGGTSLGDPVMPSAGGVAGESEPAISGLESFADTLTEPLGPAAVALASLLLLVARLPEGRPA